MPASNNGKKMFNKHGRGHTMKRPVWVKLLTARCLNQISSQIFAFRQVFDMTSLLMVTIFVP